jgi:hypothetical protein
VLLNVDRWNSLENETDPTRLESAQLEQLTYLIHEPLVLSQVEFENSFTHTNQILNLFQNHRVDPKAFFVGKVLLWNTSQTATTQKEYGSQDVVNQYAAIAQRVFEKAQILCRNGHAENFVSDDYDACTYVKNDAWVGEFARFVEVELRTRDTIRGKDKKPRDAGNDGYFTIYLDLDRWKDLQNVVDASDLLDARTKQVALAIHEPLILAGAEFDDTYFVTSRVIGLLQKYHVDLNDLVGVPGAYDKESQAKRFLGKSSNEYAPACLSSAEIEAKIQIATAGLNPSGCRDVFHSQDGRGNCM